MDARSTQPVWTVAGVKSPRLLVLSPDGRWAAAIDPISNRLALADLEQRTSRIHSLPETAVAASFFDGALFVVSRDARLLSKIDTLGGDTRTVEVPAGATHLIAGANGVIVYASLTGRAARFDSSSLRPLATAQLPASGPTSRLTAKAGISSSPGAASSQPSRSRRSRSKTSARPAPFRSISPSKRPETQPGRFGSLSQSPSFPSASGATRARSPAPEAFGRGFPRGLLGLGLYRTASGRLP